MKSVLYVIVATALISIIPFLVTFDPECVPLRGIMIYEIFIILLLYTNIRERFERKNKMWRAFTITTYIIVTAISFIDTIEITTLLKLDNITYNLIPFITTTIAMTLLKNTKAIPLKHVNLITFAALFLHLAMFNTSITQPVLTFTLISLF